jgi:hyperosmotically inducible periplasmic protein
VRPLWTVVLLALLVPAAGCVPVAIGGAAVGGYYLGKDDRSPAEIAEDGRITTAVRARLVGDKYVDGFRIGVETYQGVVTLTGEVSTSLPREQAERLAVGVEGVKSVNNKIKVVRPKSK